MIASIERAGGTFQMDSRVGNGTRCSFELSFSVNDPNVTEEELAAGVPKSAPGKERSRHVLVVDDVDMIREGAADMIEGFGHTVITASDGVEGLQALKDNPGKIDVALIDIQMPGLCGDELIVLYREWEKVERMGKRTMRIYACTGNATSVDAGAYVRAGFDGCVSKPIYPHVFKALLSGNRQRVQSVLVPGVLHSSQVNNSSGSSNSSTPRDSPEQSCDRPDVDRSSPACFGWTNPSSSSSSTSISSQAVATAGAGLNGITYSPRFRTDVMGRVDIPQPTARASPRPSPKPSSSLAADFLVANGFSERLAPSASTAQPIGGLRPLQEVSHETSPYPSSDGTSFKSNGTPALASPEINAARYASLPQEEQQLAAEIAANLPSSVLDARHIVRTLGHSEQQATKMLERFAPYITSQLELMRTAAEHDDWAAGAEKKDRSQKNVRALAHAVKGAAGMVCASRVVAASKELQFACEAVPRANDSEKDDAKRKARAALEVFSAEVHQLLAVLDRGAKELFKGNVAFGLSASDRLTEKGSQ